MKLQAVRRAPWRLRLHHWWRSFNKGVVLDGVCALFLAASVYLLFVVFLGWSA